MQDSTIIKVGDTVNVVFAWREDENPTDKNFFTGHVKSIIRKGRRVVYFEFERLASPIPADRVTKV
jgi:hypothetical protein